MTKASASAGRRRTSAGYASRAVEPTREQAWETLTRYTKSESLLRHALAVEASTAAYARKFGERRGALARRRAAARLRLRDAPDARQASAGRRADPARGGLSGGGRRDGPLPRRAPRPAARHAAEEGALRVRRAVAASSTRARSCARPASRGSSRSRCKKKLKQPSFAAGVHREDVYKGAEELGVELDDHIRTSSRRCSRSRRSSGYPQR